MAIIWAILKNVTFRVKTDGPHFFGQHFENFGLLFIPTSGHTGLVMYLLRLAVLHV